MHQALWIPGHVKRVVVFIFSFHVKSHRLVVRITKQHKVCAIEMVNNFVLRSSSQTLVFARTNKITFYGLWKSEKIWLKTLRSMKFVNPTKWCEYVVHAIFFRKKIGVNNILNFETQYLFLWRIQSCFTRPLEFIHLVFPCNWQNKSY